ncbi:hypothetical protein BJV78DRAFT_1289563 [Lactifluus subvellereus]|nr:hypothetical protein BJV78DRAFT_1289563 [Lactifluus subvellereus]
MQYPTPSDPHDAVACNLALLPQGTHWVPGCPDTHQPPVNRDSGDRHRPPRLRSNQLISSSCPPVTANAVPSCDSYPAQTRGNGSGQRRYLWQQYASGVNYVSPPYDSAVYLAGYHSMILAEYPPSPLQLIPDSVYQGGQYATQPPAPIRYEYPPSDPTSFESFQQTLYDRVGYFMPDGQSDLPLDDQHQQSLVSNTSGFLRYDDSFDYYDHFTQRPISSVSPSSSFSELRNALVEIPSPESQPMSRFSIALPTLPTQSHSAPKRDPSEGVVGLNLVKSEYGTTSSGQPFSPMTPLNSPLLPNRHAPYPKEES